MMLGTSIGNSSTICSARLALNSRRLMAKAAGVATASVRRLDITPMTKLLKVGLNQLSF